MPRECLQPYERIRSAPEIKSLYAGGKRLYGQYCLIICHQQQKSIQYKRRLCVIVSKKIAAHAVIRNKIKRILREVFRRNKTAFPAPYDFLIIAKTIPRNISYAVYREDVLAVLTTAGTA